MMNADGPLLPQYKSVPEVKADTPLDPAAQVVFTRDHVVIQRWATRRQAEPATGEATGSGPATIHVNDSGAGIRFNFPGSGRYRPISWDEWFEHFDRHELAFVYDNDADGVPRGRYRIVKAAEWSTLLR